MTTCTTGCGRPSPSGCLCYPCTADLRDWLRRLPDLEDERLVVLGRQTAYGDRNGGRSTERVLPYDPRASELGWVVGNTLSTWVRVIHETAPTERLPVDTVPSMALWLRTRVERIRQHEAGAELHGDIRALVDELTRLIDRPADRWYAGPCDGCGTALYARQGAVSVGCTGCEHAPYDLAARREWLLKAVEDVLATTSEIGRALPMLGRTVSASAIRGYVHRDRLVAHGTDQRGRPLYRIGDVLDLLA